MQDHEFDLALIQQLLETGDLFSWSGTLPDLPPSINDPLEAMYVRLELYTEVHDTADLLGQCMLVGVNNFLDPTVCTR